MPANLLLTGAPGSGKSTALERAAEALRAEGLTVGGLVSPEMRTLGHRVGFRIEDVATGEGATMAHVDHDQGPSVGKYRVDVEAVDRVSEQALGDAPERADVVLIDEIAPMETFSDVFVERTREALDAPGPVIGAIHRKATRGFIGEVKGRGDVELLEVDEGNRDAIPAHLVEAVDAVLEDAG